MFILIHLTSGAMYKLKKFHNIIREIRKILFIKLILKDLCSMCAQHKHRSVCTSRNINQHFPCLPDKILDPWLPKNIQLKNLCLAEPVYIPGLCKQCRSRSVGF